MEGGFGSPLPFQPQNHHNTVILSEAEGPAVAFSFQRLSQSRRTINSAD
jgi:hypothetical protein